METFLDIAEELHIKGLTRDKTSSKSTSSPTPAKRARTSAQGKVINIVPRPQDYEDSSESYKTSYFEDSTEYAAYDDDYSNPGPSQTYSKPNPPGGQDKVTFLLSMIFVRYSVPYLNTSFNTYHFEFVNMTV